MTAPSAAELVARLGHEVMRFQAIRQADPDDRPAVADPQKLS